MKITIYDYDYKRKIDFKNDAKGIRDFILLLNKMFKEHVDGKKDNYRKIWTIYTFIKWYEVFFES